MFRQKETLPKRRYLQARRDGALFDGTVVDAPNDRDPLGWEAVTDIDRLPKWAQDRIRSLETELRDLHQLLSDEPYQPRWAEDAPRVFLHTMIGTSFIERAIAGGSATVVFRSVKSCVEVSISATRDGFAIRASARDIAIFPEASNVVRLEGGEQ